MPERTKAHRQVEAYLRRQTLPWKIVSGSKHKHVILDGHRIGVIQQGGQSSRDGKDVIRAVEKYARDHDLP